MPFTIKLGRQNDPSTLQVVPPKDHFPVGTRTIGFQNICRDFAVAVEFPDDLLASPNPLPLGPGESVSVQIGTNARGEYSCNTYITGPSSPTRGAKSTGSSAKYVYTVSRPDPPGEPIIILE